MRLTREGTEPLYTSRAHHLRTKSAGVRRSITNQGDTTLVKKVRPNLAERALGGRYRLSRGPRDPPFPEPWCPACGFPRASLLSSGANPVQAGEGFVVYASCVPDAHQDPLFPSDRLGVRSNTNPLLPTIGNLNVSKAATKGERARCRSLLLDGTRDPRGSSRSDLSTSR